MLLPVPGPLVWRWPSLVVSSAGLVVDSLLWQLVVKQTQMPQHRLPIRALWGSACCAGAAVAAGAARTCIADDTSPLGKAPVQTAPNPAATTAAPAAAAHPPAGPAAAQMPLHTRRQAAPACLAGGWHSSSRGTQVHHRWCGCCPAAAAALQFPMPQLCTAPAVAAPGSEQMHAIQ